MLTDSLRPPQVSVPFPFKQVRSSPHDQLRFPAPMTCIGKLMVMLLFPEAYFELQEGVGGYRCLRLRQP